MESFDVGALTQYDDLIEALYDPGTRGRIARTGARIISLLLEKNRSYGNSALDPVEVFVKGLTPQQRMAVRMDDKISRLMKGDNTTFNEDAYTDLAGYLILLLSLEEDCGPVVLQSTHRVRASDTAGSHIVSEAR